MQVVITGGSGFVGTHLGRFLLNQGHSVSALGTRPAFNRIDHPGFQYLCADTTRPGDWQQLLPHADLIVNLAGRSIFQRWSRKYKQQIYNSRILTTRHLVEALPTSTSTTLISTSAVGYYGHCGDSELTEAAPLGRDFLSGLSQDWEAEALAAASKGARVVLARFGIVLGSGGGALAKMVPAFRSFVGGPLGDGRQWFPWIHIKDLVGALNFLATRSDLEGAYNLSAPHPVRNLEMAQTLGRILARPAKMAVPAFMLKLTMGELADVLLSSQRAVPAKLLEAGYRFQFPKLEAALSDLT